MLLSRVGYIVDWSSADELESLVVERQLAIVLDSRVVFLQVGESWS